MSKIGKIISGVFKRKSSAPMTGDIRPFSPGKFVELNGALTWMPDKLESYIVDGFQGNDIIFSMTNMIMEKVKVAPWSLYKIVDEQALKAHHAFVEQKNFVEAKRMHKKALEPIKNFNRQTGRLKELLNWPNEEDTFNEVVAGVAGYMLIVGNNFMWGNLLQAGANEGLPGELWNTYAQKMDVIATRAFPQRKTGYRLKHDIPQNFTTAEIMHEKLFNPTSVYIGQSPLKAARKTVTRNNSSKKAASMQFQNNGAPGIAYIDDPIVPANGREKQAKEVKRSLRENYSGEEAFNDVPISGYKMGYVQIGMSLREMALTDIEMVDLRILCNIAGIPSQLMNDFANKSYNNQKEAEKALTSRCAVPRLTGTRNNLNRKLQTDWGFKGLNVYADFDLSVYTELQEDQKEKWEWVSRLPVPSGYKLEMMGLDVPDDPNMDVILVDGNLVPLADVINAMSDDERRLVDEELNKAGLRDYLRVAQ